MKVFFRYFFIVLSIAIVGILFLASLEKLINLSLVSSVPDGHIPQRIDLHYKDHLLLAYLHIIPGMLFLLLGAHQLIPYFRIRNYPRHRLIGKLFLILSAIIFSTAIILGVMYPFGDYLESIVTFIFGIFLLFCTYRAYRSARDQQFVAHRNWVTRIYFIAIAVSTIRGLAALFIALGLGNLQTVFGLAFLSAFVIHAFVVELWIKYLAD